MRAREMVACRDCAGARFLLPHHASKLSPEVAQSLRSRADSWACHSSTKQFLRPRFWGEIQRRTSISQ